MVSVTESEPEDGINVNVYNSSVEGESGLNEVEGAPSAEFDFSAMPMAHSMGNNWF